MTSSITPLLICTLFATNPLYAGKYVKMCRDQNGNPYFSDVSCPADTDKIGTFYAPSAQTYNRQWSGHDMSMLRKYDQRNQENLSRRHASMPPPPAQVEEQPSMTFEEARAKALEVTGYRNYGRLTDSQKERVDNQMAKYNYRPPEITDDATRHAEIRGQQRLAREQREEERKEEADRIRQVERTYTEEKRYQDIGIRGREHSYLEAAKACKETFRADCRGSE